MLIVGGELRDNTSVRVFTNKVSKLEKLHLARIQVVKTNGIQ